MDAYNLTQSWLNFRCEFSFITSTHCYPLLPIATLSYPLLPLCSSQMILMPLFVSIRVQKLPTERAGTISDSCQVPPDLVNWGIRSGYWWRREVTRANDPHTCLTCHQIGITSQRRQSSSFDKVGCTLWSESDVSLRGRLNGKEVNLFSNRSDTVYQTWIPTLQI